MAMIFRPKAEESRAMLHRLRASLGLSTAGLAALLGVPKVTARSWMDGKRSPTGAATRLIWILTVGAEDPATLAKLGSWVKWSRPGCGE